jgi:hypothetical protein
MTVCAFIIIGIFVGWKWAIAGVILYGILLELSAG